jgi:uncharacterized RDD family membrane protein YckC
VRFFAHLIDLLIQGGLILAARIAFILASDTILAAPILFTFSTLDIAAYFVGVSYFVLMTYFTGTTAGKFMLNLRVISADGNKMTFFNVVYRETIGRYLSGLLLIGYAIIVFHPQKRALHDILGNTRVVYTAPVLAYPAGEEGFGCPPPERERSYDAFDEFISEFEEDNRK